MGSKKTEEGEYSSFSTVLLYIDDSYLREFNAEMYEYSPISGSIDRTYLWKELFLRFRHYFSVGYRARERSLNTPLPLFSCLK